MNAVRAMLTVTVVCGVMASLAPAAPTTKPKTESELLAEQLAGKDPGEAREAIVRVRELLETEPAKAVGELRGRWLKALSAGKRHEDVVDLALVGILIQPANIANVHGFQDARVRALLAAGKKSEALANAKGLNPPPPAARPKIKFPIISSSDSALPRHSFLATADTGPDKFI